MKKPYRSLDFNNERKWKATDHLDDVLQVGKHKAIGYVVENISYTHKDFDMQALAGQLYAEGKLLRVVTEGDLLFLWAGDCNMIATILEANKSLIEKNGWPLTAEVFFDRLSVEDIKHSLNAEMYHLVCDLFNSWCLWCEVPVRKKFVDGSTRFISANPYDPDDK